MKLASSLFVTLGVPAVAFFVVTASPARLYAEAAPAPSACTAPDVTACADAAASSACAYDGGSGFCQSALCTNPDSGTTDVALVCKPFVSNCASESQRADCVGKSVAAACGTNVSGGGHCGFLNCGSVDGGTTPTLVCLYTGGELQPEAGPKEDSGPAPDAAKNDAAPTGDGSTSTTPPPASDDEGCSVAVAGAPGSALGPAATLFAMALAAITSRRRRR